MEKVLSDAGRAMIAATERRLRRSPHKRATDLAFDAGIKLRALDGQVMTLRGSITAATATHARQEVDQTIAQIGASILAARAIAAALADVAALVNGEVEARKEIADATAQAGVS